MKKLLALFLPLLIPFASAEDDCSLLNLASCIPQKIFNFLMNILNAPLQPLLDLTKSLLTEPIQLSVFVSLWAIILYVLSIFYGILMFYSGFNFIISGYDPAKRAKAKEWFMNIFIMIVLVQASYFLYSLVIDINSYLTVGMLNLVDPSFFQLTADNITNIGLQFLFASFYVFVLMSAVLFLTFRYLIVAAGVVFVPIGLFLYFIPPLKDYGKLILNFIGICIFVSFFDSIIILFSSRLIEIPLFADFKILVMISTFLTANFLMFYFTIFSVIKSSINFKILVMISTFLTANFLMFYFTIFSVIKSSIKTAERVAFPVMAVAKYFA